MKAPKEEPEIDQEPGALHPRLRMDLFGHEEAEAALADHPAVLASSLGAIGGAYTSLGV